MDIPNYSQKDSLTKSCLCQLLRKTVYGLDYLLFQLLRKTVYGLDYLLFHVTFLYFKNRFSPHQSPEGQR